MNGCVVALAYFRAGYTPRDYAERQGVGRAAADRAVDGGQVSDEWPIIWPAVSECSRCCPAAGVLERFISAGRGSSDSVVLHRACGLCQAGRTRRVGTSRQLWPIPASFVLKPQREGGGNNLWGDDMVEKLKTPPALRSWPHTS